MQAARKKVVIRHFVSEIRSLPWEHGYSRDEFEQNFWRVFSLVKSITR